MKIEDISDAILTEVKASKKLCKSSIPNHKLGASQLSSCKAQGLRTREGKKRHRIGGQVKPIAGKRVKAKKYGGPIPNYD